MSLFYMREAGAEGYIVTGEKRAPGVDLEALLRRSKPPVRVAMEIGAALADVLSIAAEDGYLHGDIRSGYVRIDANGSVSLEAFGIPRRSCRAPETVPSGPATDIYSLGMLLHHLLAGEPMGAMPREPDAHDDEVVNRILAMNFGELSNRAWIQDVHRFMALCLAYDPRERPIALDVANVLLHVSEQIPGMGLVEWAQREVAVPDQPAVPTPIAAPPVAENLGGPSASRGPLATGSFKQVEARQAPAAKGESTAMWSRDRIAAMLSDDEDEAQSQGFRRPSAAGEVLAPATFAPIPGPAAPRRPAAPPPLQGQAPRSQPFRPPQPAPPLQPAPPPQPAQPAPPLRPMGPVASGPVASGPVASGPVASGPVASGPTPTAAPPKKKGGCFKWVIIGFVVFVLLGGALSAVGWVFWRMKAGTVDFSSLGGGDVGQEDPVQDDAVADVEPVRERKDTGEAQPGAAKVEEPTAVKPASDAGTTSKTTGSTTKTTGSTSSAGSTTGSTTKAGTTTSTTGTTGSTGGKSKGRGSSKDSTTTTAPSTAPTTSTPPADNPAAVVSGSYEVTLIAMGAQAKLGCGDGQTRTFIGTTHMTFSGVVTCSVQINKGRTAIQTSKATTLTCVEVNGQVTCSGS